MSSSGIGNGRRPPLVPSSIPAAVSVPKTTSKQPALEPASDSVVGYPPAMPARAPAPAAVPTPSEPAGPRVAAEGPLGPPSPRFPVDELGLVWDHGETSDDDSAFDPLAQTVGKGRGLRVGDDGDDDPLAVTFRGSAFGDGDVDPLAATFRGSAFGDGDADPLAVAVRGSAAPVVDGPPRDRGELLPLLAPITERERDSIVRSGGRYPEHYLTLDRGRDEEHRGLETRLTEALARARDQPGTVSKHDPRTTVTEVSQGIEPTTRSGVASAQGGRKTMEDTHVAGRLPDGRAVVAVFDGHGGRAAAESARDRLLPCLARRDEDLSTRGLLDDERAFNFLKLGIGVDLHRQILADIADDHSGCTANVAIIGEKEVWFANAGDTRGILVSSDGTVQQVTADAKASDPFEAEAIRKRGGYVEDGRVSGLLEVARALGDRDIEGLPHRPTVTYVPRERGSFLIQACDGIWDVFTSTQVGSLVYGLAKEGKRLDEIAARVVQDAYQLGSGDNLSVIITPL